MYKSNYNLLAKSREMHNGEEIREVDPNLIHKQF